MDIHTAAKYMQHGYRIRRDSSKDLVYLVMKDETLWEFSTLLGFLPAYPLLEDLLADDWELITEGITNYFPVEYAT